MDYYERKCKDIIYEQLVILQTRIELFKEKQIQELKLYENPYRGLEYEKEIKEGFTNILKEHTNDLYNQLMEKTNGIL